MRDYAELILDLRRHHCDAKEDDTQEVCEECAYDVIVADKSKFNGITDVCTCGLMHRAADAIEELLDELTTIRKQLPHWISVEDEPPKENGRYLVRYKRDVNLGDEETVHEDEIRIMRFFVDDGWRYPIICNDHVRLVNEEVTHWMPLPAPPKGVE